MLQWKVPWYCFWDSMAWKNAWKPVRMVGSEPTGRKSRSWQATQSSVLGCKKLVNDMRWEIGEPWTNCLTTGMLWPI